MRPVLYLELKKLPEGPAHQGKRAQYADLAGLFEELTIKNVQIAQIRWVSLWRSAQCCYTSLHRFATKHHLPYRVCSYGINVYVIRQKT